MTTWLVTGGSGFLGRHLLAALERCARPGTRIVALDRRPPEDVPPDRFERADLDDLPALFATIERLAPDMVFHLAGLTASSDPARLYRANVGGTVHLVEALERLHRPARLVLAGSAAELGPVPLAHLPADESCPCRPMGAYGLSKWFATAYALRRGGPLDVVVARIFNPIGPGAPAGQAFGRFAAELAAPGPDPLRLTVRDLDARRDFVDARDVASALLALAVRGRPGTIYHVGTGRSRSVREGFDRLIELSGRRVRLAHQSTAPQGPAESRADIARIERETGWTPRIDWEQSLLDLWVEMIQRNTARHVA
jgi:GDP-4-dehydro-6-deoxy-D-mannose reductase